MLPHGTRESCPESHSNRAMFGPGKNLGPRIRIRIATEPVADSNLSFRLNWNMSLMEQKRFIQRPRIFVLDRRLWAGAFGTWFGKRRSSWPEKICGFV